MVTFEEEATDSATYKPSFWWYICDLVSQQRELSSRTSFLTWTAGGTQSNSLWKKKVQECSGSCNTPPRCTGHKIRGSANQPHISLPEENPCTPTGISITPCESGPALYPAYLTNHRAEKVCNEETINEEKNHASTWGQQLSTLYLKNPEAGW